jgi:fucose permease
LSVIAFFLLLSSKLDESGTKISGSSLADDFVAMIKLIVMPLVLIFIACVFLYVLIEQSFQTWTPTFYKDILKVPASMGIQAGAVLAGAFAIGRFMAGAALKKFKWVWVVTLCIICCAIVVSITLPLTHGIIASDKTSWLNAPFVAYLFPLMGVFLAPIYPTINSVILSSLPKHLHSPMSGLIVVFSALGGTTGSIITGHVFDSFSGQTAFYLSLIPMTLLLICAFIYNGIQKKTAATIEFKTTGGH